MASSISADCIVPFSSNRTLVPKLNCFDLYVTNLTATNFQQVEASTATPEYYGAKADGITDDTAAIQQCIDENSICEFAPGKRYRITTYITLTSFSTLEGNGAMIVQNDGTTWDNAYVPGTADGTMGAFYYEAGFTTAHKSQYIIVRNLAMHGMFHCFEAYASSDIVLQYFTMLKYNYGFYTKFDSSLDTCANITMDNCSATLGRGAAIYMFYTTRLTVKNSTFHDFGYYGIVGQDNTEFTMRDTVWTYDKTYAEIPYGNTGSTGAYSALIGWFNDNTDTAVNWATGSTTIEAFSNIIELTDSRWYNVVMSTSAISTDPSFIPAEFQDGVQMVLDDCKFEHLHFTLTNVDDPTGHAIMWFSNCYVENQMLLTNRGNSLYNYDFDGCILEGPIIQTGTGTVAAGSHWHFSNCTTYPEYYTPSNPFGFNVGTQRIANEGLQFDGCKFNSLTSGSCMNLTLNLSYSANLNLRFNNCVFVGDDARTTTGFAVMPPGATTTAYDVRE